MSRGAAQSVYAQAAVKRATSAGQAHELYGVVLSDAEEADGAEQASGGDDDDNMGAPAMIGARQDFFDDESESESDDYGGGGGGGGGNGSVTFDAVDLEAGGSTAPETPTLGIVRKFFSGAQFADDDDDDNDNDNDNEGASFAEEQRKRRDGDYWTDESSDESTGAARITIGAESFGSFGGSADDDDDDDDEEQAYQFTLIGDGMYYVWNMETGQAFFLAHETRPEVAFCRALDAEEADVRSQLAEPVPMSGDELRAATGQGAHSQARVPGILGFFVERVLRTGKRSEQRAAFELRGGATASASAYQTPSSAAGDSATLAAGSLDAELAQLFLRADELQVSDLLGGRSPTVRDALIGLRNANGRDTWMHEERHVALFRALCDQGKLSDFYAVDDAHRLGHLRRFKARGDTCFVRPDAPTNDTTTTSVSPVTPSDSAWFVLVPTYVALCRAHFRMRDASQSLLLRMRTNPAAVANSAAPRRNGIAVEPLVAEIAKQAADSELAAAARRQRVAAHVETAIDRLVAAKPRIERLAANTGALAPRAATASGTAALVDALAALFGQSGAKALVGAELVDPANELAHTLRDVVDLLGECEQLQSALRACHDADAAEWEDDRD